MTLACLIICNDAIFMFLRCPASPACGHTGINSRLSRLLIFACNKGPSINDVIKVHCKI
jgi:hypothetical protein